MTRAKPIPRDKTAGGPQPPQGADASVEIARRLVRAADRGVLSTRSSDHDGWPYGSLVMIAPDHDLSPILLLSDLAEHTKNLAADPRVSLLVDGTAGVEDPLSAPRVTLIGRIARSEDRAIAARYIAHHPAAALHAGFPDFHYYRLVLERAHLVAGFGRIAWLESSQLQPPVPEALVRDERKLVEALNQDAGLVRRLAAALGGETAEGWKIAGVDRDGLDLRQRSRMLRAWFDQPVERVDEALAAIETMLRPPAR